MSCVTSLVTPWAQKNTVSSSSSLQDQALTQADLFLCAQPMALCSFLRSLVEQPMMLYQAMTPFVLLSLATWSMFFSSESCSPWSLCSTNGCGQRPFLWLVQLQFLSDPWWWSSAEISSWRLWHLHIEATEYPFLTFVCFLNRHSNNLVCIYICDVYVNIKKFGLQFFPEETITIPLRMLYASIYTAQTPHIGAI